MVRLWCKFMLWAVQFELAITPQNAGHYHRLKQDRTYWEGEVLKVEVNKRGMAI